MNDHVESPADELLILVDNDDNEVGILDKVSVHKEGKLHRAFSIFVFNSFGYLMLQRRALNKYHSPGLWSNTCCSHPRPGETTLDASSRRLSEEMGMKCPLASAFSFTYQAQFSNGLTEHEFDHVFMGFSNTTPKPDPEEVMEWKYISLNDLQQDILMRPHDYTEWLKICLPKVIEHIEAR